jgi:undecaprenyl-diphosphatase
MPPETAQVVALGLIQGATELLPVSSSAHVAMVPWLLGWELAAWAPERRKELEVALHAGTALALIDRRPLRWGLLIAATAPPALAGLVFERTIETRLGTPRSIAAGLVAGSLAMVLADRTPARRAEPTISDGLWLGVAQTLALIPGVSRSGATLAAARCRGFGRAEAAALSREVALPVLAGAATLKGVRLLQRRPPRRTLATLTAGAAAATMSTAIARCLKGGQTPLAVFAAYRVALAVVLVWQDRDR